jgi:serine/threonine protein kinase/Tol biopolymer transport system component
MASALTAGMRLGPYEISTLLGVGGMGEVYRARDPRLNRDVAIKVLPREVGGDPDRVKRFEREARAAGQLNHPHIMAVYDVGTTGEGAQDLSYIVCELLEGMTLRRFLERGPLPPRRAVALTIQIAKGLDAAHAKGIVHRDLKPENVMVLSGHHAKVLDFGLAKIFQPAGASSGGQPGDEPTGTMTAHLTKTGMIMGTASYMAPEQVRNLPADHRADLFSLGAILYETLSGRKAFDGATPMDRMSAILNSEPQALPAEVEEGAPGVSAVIAHCLEKSPAERFQSAKDLGFALSLVDAAAAPERKRVQVVEPDAVETRSHRPRSFRRVTYREGSILTARFSPDGQSIGYGAAWEGRPMELFWSFPGSTESRALGFPNTDLLSIAPNGEMAVSLRRRPHSQTIMYTGMLARMPIGGGAPREIADGIMEADWSPDGRTLAVVREETAMSRVEFPIGNVLYQTPGWVSHIRVSPQGTHVAFLDHPYRNDDMGSVGIVGLNREHRTLSTGWSSERGLAWSPDGSKVLFTGFRSGGVGRSLWALSLDGDVRLLLEVPGHLTVMDVSRQGSLLVSLENERVRTQFIAPDLTRPRDLSWLDRTIVRGVSPDGTEFVFDETGVGAGGSIGSLYARPTDGSPAVRLGDGMCFDLSPDGQSVLSGIPHPGKLEIYPLGAGSSRSIPLHGLDLQFAQWFPDMKSVCVLGQEAGHGTRLYRVDSTTGEHVPLSEEGISHADLRVSPDGRLVAAHGPDHSLWIVPVDGRPFWRVPGSDSTDRLVAWSSDGRTLFTYRGGILPAVVERIEIDTGKRSPWKELTPSDPTGVNGLTRVRMARDEQTFVYSFLQRLSELYVVEGLF